MSDAPWTPGQWKRWDDCVVVDHKGIVVEGNCSTEIDVDENYANLRLIAKAPEMAESLRLLRDAVDSEYCSGSYHIDECRVATALLAEIKGEP